MTHPGLTMRGLAMIAALALGGCGPAPTPPTVPAHPLRVVSLDYCADQYVLKLLPRARILAVSPDADKAFSYMRGAAAGVATVAPRAEDVLTLKPDLVVRSYGGGPDVTDLLARAHVPVLQLGYADDLDGVRRVLADTAAGLDAKAAGAEVLADFDRRLTALPAAAKGRSILYVTAGGVTSGPGTMIDKMLTRAGFTNFEDAPGWRPIPLETLAYRQPDAVAAAFFNPSADDPDPWSLARHPVLRRELAGRPTVTLDDAWTACGGWFLIDAIEALAAAKR